MASQIPNISRPLQRWGGFLCVKTDIKYSNPICQKGHKIFFLLDMFPQISYNVGMKDKEIKIRADEDFIEKVDYLQRINGHKNRSETVRKTIEKEYRKEKEK